MEKVPLSFCFYVSLPVLEVQTRVDEARLIRSRSAVGWSSEVSRRIEQAAEVGNSRSW